MAKKLFDTPGLTVSAVMTSVAAIIGWDTADTARNTEMEEAITAAGQAACTFEGRAFWWAKRMGRFRSVTATLTQAARSSNVTTVTAASHGLALGQYVVLGGIATSGFNGFYRIASVPSANTFTVRNDGSDATDSAGGTVYVASYALRQVSGGAMEDLWAPRSVWIRDSHRLGQVSREEWDTWMHYNDPTGTPWAYCLFADDYAEYSATPTYTRELYVGLLPCPANATTDIIVPYVIRHSKIVDGASGSEDAALVVPPEFQRSVYIDGSAYLLKQDVNDPSLLANSQRWISAMRRMQASEPEGYDDGEPGGGWPADRSVHVNAGSLTP